VALALVAYANSFHNRALFHHAPHPFGDAVVDNILFRSGELWPQVFSPELLLHSLGEYRPVGYALFALVNGALPPGDHPLFWHLFMVGLHVLTASCLFLVLRGLLAPVMAAGVAATYATLPVLAPVNNNLALVHLSWGLLFTAAALPAFLSFLRSGRRGWLALSVTASAAAVFSSPVGTLVPVFLAALALFHRTRPALCGVLVPLSALVAYGVGLVFPSPWVMAGVLAVLVVAAGAGLSVDRRWQRALVPVIPSVVVVAAYQVVQVSVERWPRTTVWLRVMEREGLLDVLTWESMQRHLLGSSWMVPLCLVLAAAVVVLAARSDGPVFVVVGFALGLGVFTTLKANSRYRDDVRHFSTLQREDPASTPLQAELGYALIDAGRYQEAVDVLLPLVHERKLPDLSFAPVIWKVARAYEGMGQDKVAGYYYLRVNRPLAPSWFWTAKAMKPVLEDVGAWAFRMGYLSTAEHYYACASVPDENDLSVNYNLGRILLYKNFFRAARRYFTRVLELEPRHAESMYHLAYIAHVLAEGRAEALARQRWQEATGATAPPDYGWIQEGYRFDVDKAEGWFTRDPLYFAMAAKPVKQNPYELSYEGRTFEFHEVGLQLGLHYLRRGLPDVALQHLGQAQEVSPGAPEVAWAVAEARSALRAAGPRGGGP
jgi:tetratricopeptide (TPR) repeat protein